MIRPPQTCSNVNGNNGGEKGRTERKEEAAEELGKRNAGQQRAEEREIATRAARRACAYGLKLMDKPETARKETPNCKSKRDEYQQANIGNPKASEHMRKCEAVTDGFCS